MIFGWLKRQYREVSAEVNRFESIPLPTSDTVVAKISFLVIDMELTGLNPRKDHIVSIGWVPVRKQEIVLAEARHYLINSPISVGQSAAFHGVHDRQLSQGLELAEVLTELLVQYAGYVLVAHHSKLEHTFLRITCQRLFGKSPRFRFVDTMQIEWNRLLQQGKSVRHDSLQLSACLNRHKLPVSAQHHALEDAYSCALLFLSQLKQSGHCMTLAELFRLSR